MRSFIVCCSAPLLQLALDLDEAQQDPQMGPQPTPKRQATEMAHYPLPMEVGERLTPQTKEDAPPTKKSGGSNARHQGLELEPVKHA